MVRIFVSFLLLFVFLTSDLGCSIEQILGSNTQCLVGISDCTPQQSGPLGQQPDVEHHHFCCTHFADISEKPVVTVFLSSGVQTYIPFSFLYQNPTLDSLERPPLAV